MNRRFRTILAGALAAAIAATMGVTVLAATTDEATSTPAVTAAASATTTPPVCNRGENRPALTDAQKAQMKADMDSRMKTKLDELAAAGTITQEQADAAYEVITAGTGRIDFSALPAEVATALKNAIGKGHDGIFSDLTDTQKAAVKTVMDESMNSALTSLVAAGTITQAQADAISAEPHDRTAMESLTAEQRDAIRTAMDTARDAGLATLVSNGTLTQAQADKMANGPHGGGRGGHGGPGGFGGMGRPNDNDADDSSTTTAT